VISEWRGILVVVIHVSSNLPLTPRARLESRRRKPKSLGLVNILDVSVWGEVGRMEYPAIPCDGPVFRDVGGGCGEIFGFHLGYCLAVKQLIGALGSDPKVSFGMRRSVGQLCLPKQAYHGRQRVGHDIQIYLSSAEGRYTERYSKQIGGLNPALGHLAGALWKMTGNHSITC
jgi:hypothetical protein